MSLNIAVLIGRLTADPELRYTSNGIANCTFTLAVDRPFTNQQGQREADFIRVSVWRNQAERVAENLRKGSRAAVEGRIQTRTVESEKGKRTVVEVVAETVRFLDGAKRDEQTSGTNDNRNSQKDPFADDGKPVGISDEDLPF